MSSSAQSRSSLSDERLIELCRGGDELAFEAIVERYRAPLLRHCRGIAAEEAQDAVQQAFIEAWSALRSRTEVRHLRAWLFTIARRAALQGLRRRGEQSSELPESLAGDHSPAEQFERAATTRDIFAAITDLPDAEHDALVSMSFHGRSARMTARELGVSEGAVRQLVFRARARVRAAARVFVPPIPVFRLLGGPGHARRIAALSNAAPSASPAAAGTLSKLAVIALLGAGVAAPIAALRVGDQAHPSHLSPTTESGAVGSRSSAGNGAASISKSRHPAGLSTPGASRVKPPGATVAAGAIAPGASAPAAISVGAPPQGTSDAGSSKHSANDSRQPSGTNGPRPGTVVDKARPPAGLAPPVAQPTTPTPPPLPSAGQVAAEAEGAVKGSTEAAGRLVQETAPVQPKALPTLP